MKSFVPWTSVQLADVQKFLAQAQAEAEDEKNVRWELIEQQFIADGVLDIVRWEGNMCLRIWKPAGTERLDEFQRLSSCGLCMQRIEPGMPDEITQRGHFCRLVFAGWA